MNVAASHQPKMHSNPPSHQADMSHDGVAQSVASHAIKSGVEGELHDMPGQHAAQMVTMDYSEGRHEAYDSPLAQPAYSGHGKVRTGSTSAL